MLKNLKKYLQFLFLIALIGYVISLMMQVKHKTLEYKKMSHMSEVGPYILNHIKHLPPQDVLCAFDIDMTLILPDHPACYIKNIKQYISVYRDIQKQYASLDATLPFVWAFAYPQHLIDSGIFSTLEDLKAVKKIAFTATFTGPYLNYPRLEVLRYEQLREKEISFEDSFPEKDFILEECPAYRSRKPAFYKGVLCSNSENGTTTKGSVLCAFLRKLRWIPKCVILVDDRLKNLSDVEESLKDQYPQIKFIGIQFTGAAHYCPKAISEADFKAFWTNCFEQAQRKENLQ